MARPRQLEATELRHIANFLRWLKSRKIIEGADDGNDLSMLLAYRAYLAGDDHAEIREGDEGYRTDYCQRCETQRTRCSDMVICEACNDDIQNQK